MKQITITEQLNGDYFTFYDNYLGSILREFTGFEYPSVRASIDDTSGAYGAVYVNSKFGRRVCSISGDLVDADVFTLRRTLSKALRQTGTIKLIQFTTYDDLDLQFEAEITKQLMPYTHGIHKYLIEMTAPDWRFYSQAESSNDIAQTIIRGGMSIPATVPFSLPSPTDVNTETTTIITNEGNESSAPTITITGPGVGFIIGNDTADKQLFLDYTLTDTDVVVIDVKERTVVLNGTDNLYQYISGDFWDVLPGENVMRFLVNSGLTTDTNLNITFRHAYSGI